MSEQQSLSSKDLLPTNPEAQVDYWIRQLNMPETTARLFRERMSGSPEDAIKANAEDAVGYRVDRERTGLEIEVVLIEEIADHFINKINEYAIVEREAEDENALDIVFKFVYNQLSSEDKKNLLQEFSSLYSDQTKLNAEILKNSLLEYYLTTEARQHAFIAADLQKLKACNDFGAFQIEGMDPQTYVDQFGFVELGRRWQALSAILGSDQYHLPLQNLDGQTRFDPLNNFEKIPISKEIYEQEVRKLADPALVDYCISHGLTVKFASKRSAGDELTIRVSKTRNEDASANPLTSEDLEVVMSLVDSVSNVDIGVYDKQDTIHKKRRAKDIFQDRYCLPEGDLKVGFSVRLGTHRMDQILDQGDYDTDPNNENPEDEMKKFISKKVQDAIGKANEQMEINKRKETFDQLFSALNGDSKAQLAILLLIEQGRFPGKVETLKEIIMQNRGQEINNTNFNNISTRLERRTDSDHTRAAYRYPKSVIN